MTDFALAGAGWLFAGASGTLLAAARLAMRRRRDRINQAFHELRRPLQALTLASHRPPVDRDVAVRQVELACAALADAEHALNGGTPPARRSLVSARRLLTEACGRWRRSAELDGARLRLHWSGPDAGVFGEPAALAAALDNLIANAIEHGGPDIAAEGRVSGWKVRLAVTDRGAPGRPRRPARLAGSRGRGLRVVARTVKSHGGRFLLEPGEGRFAAVIELPALRVDSRARPAALHGRR